MKTLMKYLCGLCLLCVVCVSCGDDNELRDPYKQYKDYLSKGNETRPEWEEREGLYTEYESTMSVQIQLQNILLPYLSDEDLMCAVIDDDVRAVASPAHTGGQIYFPLVIAGNSSDGEVCLHYYCKKLQRTYIIEDWMPFTPGLSPLDNGEPYKPKFIPGAL